MTTSSPRVALSLGVPVLVLFCLASGAIADPVVASAAQSSAQLKKDYALIYGTVWGPDDRRVPGVPIKIRRASDKKAKWELLSDSSGEFAQRVPVGAQDYVIQADIKMPKGQPKPEVTVHIDDNEREDTSLHLTQQELPRR